MAQKLTVLKNPTFRYPAKVPDTHLSFVGANADYVDCGTHFRMDEVTKQFSVSAWINPSVSKTTGNSPFWSTERTVSNRMGDALCWFNTDTNVITYTLDYTNAVPYIIEAISTSPIPKGRWAHVVTIVDNLNQKVTLVINGVPETFDFAYTPVLTVAYTNFEIGRWRNATWGTAYFDGKISNVRIYDNYLLPVEEAQAQYFRGVNDYGHSDEVGLTASYHLNEGTGIVAIDAKESSQNHGTLLGSGTQEDRWVNATPRSYRESVLHDGPKAYWRMKETSGFELDDETGNYGKLMQHFNAPLIGQEGPFPGSNSVAYTRASSHFSQITQNILNTIDSVNAYSGEAWIKITESPVPSDGAIVSQRDASSNKNFDLSVANSPANALDHDEVDTNVQLLLHMDGTDASTTFTDSSTYNRTVTPTGSAQIDTANSKFGGASGLFNGTGDSLLIPTATVLDLDGGALFTIDAWGYIPTAYPGDGSVVISKRDDLSNTAGWRLYVTSTGVLQWAMWNTASGVYVLPSGGTVPLDTWFHMEVGYDGTTWRVWVDGIIVDSTATSTGTYDPATGYAVYVSYDFGSKTREWVGHLDDVRVTIGSTRHTANFTPPTQPQVTAAGLATSANTIFPDVWHHVAWTKDFASSLREIYIDGVLSVSDATPEYGNTTTMDRMLIGSNFEGHISEVAVYDYKLSSQQVYEHWLASLASVPYYNRVITSAPDGYFRLNDLGSPALALDSSGGAKNGSWVGTPTLGVAGLIGDGDTAAYFDGASYVQMDSSADFNIVSQDFAIELWVQTSQTTGNIVFWDKRINPNYSGYLVGMKLGLVTMSSKDAASTTREFSGLINVADGLIHHIVCNFSWTVTDEIWVDGVLDQTGNAIAGASNLSQLSVPVKIGWSDGVTSFTYFQGTMDEVAFYNGRTLTSGEIRAHYLAGVNI